MSEYTLQNSDKVGSETPPSAVAWAAGAAALSLISSPLDAPHVDVPIPIIILIALFTH